MANRFLIHKWSRWIELDEVCEKDWEKVLQELTKEWTLIENYACERRWCTSRKIEKRCLVLEWLIRRNRIENAF